MKIKWVAYPYYLWAAIFVIIPLILIIYFAFTSTVDGQIVFTAEHFEKAFTPLYLTVIRRSVVIALECTVLCFIFGYPVAYILSRLNLSRKGSLLFLFIVPMWMNFLLRTYSWISILERDGLLNNFVNFMLTSIGLAPVTFNILYTDTAVLIGMVYNYLPFMILPVYTVLSKMDKSLIEAAQDLGADNKRVFAKVTFPLSLPGVISGITMVFMPAVTTFVVSSLLGGGQYILVGNLIEKQFSTLGDKNFGSALSFLLMLIILLSMAVISVVDKDSDENKGVLL